MLNGSMKKLAELKLIAKAIYKPEEKQRLTLLYNCPKIHRVEIEAN